MRLVVQIAPIAVIDALVGLILGLVDAACAVLACVHEVPIPLSPCPRHRRDIQIVHGSLGIMQLLARIFFVARDTHCMEIRVLGETTWHIVGRTRDGRCEGACLDLPGTLRCAQGGNVIAALLWRGEAGSDVGRGCPMGHRCGARGG